MFAVDDYNRSKSYLADTYSKSEIYFTNYPSECLLMEQECNLSYKVELYPCC